MKTPQCNDNRVKLYSMSHTGTSIYTLKSVLSICEGCTCYLHTENNFNYCIDR